MFSIGMGFVIITGGIELSVGSIFALLGVVFVDLLVTYACPWPIASRACARSARWQPSSTVWPIKCRIWSARWKNG